MNRIPLVLAGIIVAVGLWFRVCPTPTPTPAPDAAIVDSAVLVDTASVDAMTQTTLIITNNVTADITVYVAFGAGSVVTPNTWAAFCLASDALNCTFLLAPSASQPLPMGGQNLDATFAFGAPVGCGSTKAEVNINTPNNADTYDISLVDGWNVDVGMVVGGQVLGPTQGPNNNAQAFGVFPLSCDICVACQTPSCGFSQGTAGCKTGTQYNPTVPCQYQAPPGPVAAVINVY